MMFISLFFLKKKSKRKLKTLYLFIFIHEKKEINSHENIIKCLTTFLPHLDVNLNKSTEFERSNFCDKGLLDVIEAHNRSPAFLLIKVV